MPLHDPRLDIVWSTHPGGPWNAEVFVTVARVNRGRLTITPSDYMFTAHARWHGPPALGFPPSDTAVNAGTCVVTRDQESAVRVAREAGEQLARGRVPDLKKIAGPAAVASPARTLL